MDRPLRTLNRFGYEVPNYLTPDEAKRIRKDKSDMYLQTAYTREPLHYERDIDGGIAKVYRDDFSYTLYLRSYDTIVCSIYSCYSNGLYRWYITRYWDNWSRTTAKHVDLFLRMYTGMDGLNKKQWLALPLYKPTFLGEE